MVNETFHHQVKCSSAYVVNEKALSCRNWSVACVKWVTDQFTLFTTTIGTPGLSWQISQSWAAMAKHWSNLADDHSLQVMHKQRICIMGLPGSILQGLGRRFPSKWIVNEKGSFHLIKIFHQFYPNENITLDCCADLRHMLLYSSAINLCVFRMTARFRRASCGFAAFFPVLSCTGP